MSSSAPSPATVLEVVDALGPPGTPWTTSEVAAEFDCTDRTVFNKLDVLVERGNLQTKKVGARGRVWWRTLGEVTPLLEHVTEEKLQKQTEVDALHNELAAELETMRELQMVSTDLIQENDIENLSEQVLDAAIGVVDADFGSVQLFDPDRNDLELVSHRNFTEEAEKSWKRVSAEDGSTCGVALQTGERVIVPDIETSEFITETADRETFRQTGIRAVQTTPLVSRGGEVLGMFSTHWETPHNLSERDREHLDILARQAADLIKHQQITESLRKSETEFRALVDASSEVRYRMSPDWSEMQELGGRGLIIDGEEPREDWLDEYVHPDDQTMAWNAIREAIETKRSFELDHRVRRSDGTDGWVHSRAVPILDDDGEIIEWLGSGTDITERRLLEQEIQSEKQRFDVAVNNSPLIVWQMDTEFQYMWIKHPHPDFEESSVLGRRDDELLPPEAAAVVMKPKRHAMETGETVREEIIYTLQTGETVAYDLTVAPLRDETGEIIGVTCSAFDITERKEAERELQQQAKLDEFHIELADAIRSLTDPLEIQHVTVRVLGEWLDVDRVHYVEVADDQDTVRIDNEYHKTDGPSTIGEYQLSDFSELFAGTFRSGESVVIEDTQNRPGVSEESRTAFTAIDSHAHITVPLVKDGRLEALLSVLDTEPREWTDNEIEIVEETAERTWAAVERANAETALQQSYDSLKRLNTAIRELLDADSSNISGHVAKLTRDVLGVEYAALWRYHQSTGELEEDASHVAEGVDPHAVRFPDGFTDTIWKTFIGDDIHAATDLHAPVDESSASPLWNFILLPVGRHGVICVGATEFQTADSRIVDLAETVSATVEAAWDRADSEQDLAAQNEELMHLNRVNALIRGIDQVLVDAETTDEIHKAVCERLATSNLYEFAWIGEYDATSDTIKPREWAGVDSNYLDSLRITTEDTSRTPDPIATAADTRELQSVADIATDPRTASWREQTLERGARSCVSIPLTYENSLYGVLTVYLTHPYHDERNRVMLAELGRTVGSAINAVESRETRGTESVVELTLRSLEVDTPLARLSRETNCRIDIEGLVPGTNGDVTVFFTATGVGTDEFLAAGDQLLSVSDMVCLVEREDGALFNARLSGSSLISKFIDSRATLQSATIEAGTVTAVIDLPQTQGIREFVEGIQQVIPDLEMLSRRTRIRPIRTEDTYRKSVEGQLTARQREVIELAYRSGFFESPRVRTGKNLSDALDISQSTFTYHLRGAERQLCESVFNPA